MLPTSFAIEAHGTKKNASSTQPSLWPRVAVRLLHDRTHAGNLIGDRAYDSDPLDAELRKDGIEMVAPHRGN
jgi:hypothetical protein